MKNMLSTSFLSVTQATDSTCNWCKANRAATSVLLPARRSFYTKLKAEVMYLICVKID